MFTTRRSRMPLRVSTRRLAVVAALAVPFSFIGVGQAQQQPFALNDSDAVHSDAIAARYQIAKVDIDPLGSPTCDASSVTPSQECTTAVHNFCIGRGYVSGFGYASVTATDSMDITCLTSEAVQLDNYTYIDPPPVPLTANETRLKTWCLGIGNPFNMAAPNHNCDIGINRQCPSDVGFGPVSVVGNTLTFACVEPGVAESHTAVFASPPPEVDTACSVGHGSEVVGDDCHQAISEQCADHGLVGGYGPAFSLGATVDFSCLPEHEAWVANTAMPLSPALPIDVLRNEYELDGGVITKVDPPPHNRLSASIAQTYDGRVAIGARGTKPSEPGWVSFQVQVPEIFDAQLGQAQPAAPEYRESMGYTEEFRYMAVQNLRGAQATHLDIASSIAVCDTPLAGSTTHLNRSQSHKGRKSNPQACTGGGVLDVNGDHDCYDISLVARFSGPAIQNDDELWVTPVRLVVSNPKSSSSPWPTVEMPPQYIGTPKRIDILGLDILEPVVSGDGRLLVAQVEGFIQYSVIPDAYDACDADGWTEFKHITEIYADDDMAEYGIAKFPMRDTENRVISTAIGDPLNVMPGAYPWIDRDGDNLFYIAGDQSLYYIDDQDQVQPRFSILGHPLGVPVTEPTLATLLDQNTADPFNGGRKIGLTGVGLWSQGKFFMPDIRNNNFDLNIHTGGFYHRLLDIYQDLPAGVEFGSSEKVTITSPENHFNFLPNLQAETPRDLVWHLSSTYDTDEIAFDDVNHPAALIVSEMGPSLNLVRDFFAPMSLHNRYNDGFQWDYLRSGAGPATLQGLGYTTAPHIANSAAAVSQEVADFAGSFGPPNPLAAAVTWNVPTHGRLIGGGRVEPLAAGGFQAKGLWLDGIDDRVEYVVPSQPDPAAMDSASWFMTISVNPRPANPIERLVTWPDGTFVNLIQPTGGGDQRLRLKWTGGLHDVVLTDSLLKFDTDKWSTIGVLSEPAATLGNFDVTVFLDGYNVARILNIPAFRVEPGRMMLGAKAIGFRGWIDDFKVIGAKPSVEEVCNHAGGTLVGKDGSSSQEIKNLAAAYVPYGSHSRFLLDITPLVPVDSEFVCERPGLSSSPVCLGTTHGIMAAECLRPLIHLLGIPLEWNEPRENSVTNAFCLSCHTPSNPSATMRPADALSAAIPMIDMHDDPRRQPVQPFPLLNGVIPLTYFPTAPVPPATIENLDARTNPDVP